jgi:hypothetical protein
MKSGFFRIIIIAAVLSLACTTKVSEWVLINSPAERYLLVYYHRGAISEAEKRQNNQLAKRKHSKTVLCPVLPEPAFFGIQQLSGCSKCSFFSVT